MLRAIPVIGLAVVLLLTSGSESPAQRRGGGGGARGGGAPRGGGGAPRAAAPHAAAPRAGPVAGPYGGAGAGARSSGTVVGPAGGSRTVGGGSGSYTTQRGGTINYAGAGRTATTPGGVTAGRGVGGVQVTTPGGKTATHIGTAGGVAGPGGYAAGGRSGATVGSGPSGSFGTAYHGGVAVGPHGAAAGGTRAGTATGPGGTVSGVTRGAAAAGAYGATVGRTTAVAGPYGAAAARTTAARGVGGTYYASTAALRTTGTAVRTNFGYYNAFTPGWYARYPGAWFAAGWTAARIWSAPAWGTVSTYCSYPAEPVYYDYGETVVYSGDTVTINGVTEVPAEQYAQQAADLATVGKDASVEAKGDDFQPLGVFAMVGEGETKSTNLFQLAVNKDGVIRGNYYNALTDTTEPVYGSVDRQNQRAAWTVGDRKTPVYEAGVANLTKDETTMLAHFSKENSQQFTLVRIQQPESVPPPEKK
jgi:hypothetical protein